MMVIAEFQAWLQGLMEGTRNDEGVTRDGVDPDWTIDQILEKAATLDRTAPPGPFNPRDLVIGPGLSSPKIGDIAFRGGPNQDCLCPPNALCGNTACPRAPKVTS